MWPWEENYEKWIVHLKKTLKGVLINITVIGIPMTLFEGFMIDYKTSLSEWPTTQTIVWQTLLFLLV